MCTRDRGARIRETFLRYRGGRIVEKGDLEILDILAVTLDDLPLPIDTITACSCSSVAVEHYREAEIRILKEIRFPESETYHTASDIL